MKINEQLKKQIYNKIIRNVAQIVKTRLNEDYEDDYVEADFDSFLKTPHFVSVRDPFDHKKKTFKITIDERYEGNVLCKAETKDGFYITFNVGSEELDDYYDSEWDEYMDDEFEDTIIRELENEYRGLASRGELYDDDDDEIEEF